MDKINMKLNQTLQDVAALLEARGCRPLEAPWSERSGTELSFTLDNGDLAAIARGTRTGVDIEFGAGTAAAEILLAIAAEHVVDCTIRRRLVIAPESINLKSFAEARAQLNAKGHHLKRGGDGDREERVSGKTRRGKRASATLAWMPDGEFELTLIATADADRVVEHCADEDLLIPWLDELLCRASTETSAAPADEADAEDAVDSQEPPDQSVVSDEAEAEFASEVATARVPRPRAPRSQIVREDAPDVPLLRVRLRALDGEPLTPEQARQHLPAIESVLIDRHAPHSIASLVRDAIGEIEDGQDGDAKIALDIRLASHTDAQAALQVQQLAEDALRLDGVANFDVQVEVLSMRGRELEDYETDLAESAAAVNGVQFAFRSSNAPIRFTETQLQTLAWLRARTTSAEPEA